MRTIGFDKVTEKYTLFLLQNFAQIFKECLLSAFQEKQYVIYNELYSEQPQRIISINEKLAYRIEEICRRHHFFRIIILTRKTPADLVQNLIPNDFYKEHSFTRVFLDAMLYGTNCILRYSPNPRDIASTYDRNHIDPNFEEMRDAASIFILSFIHRHNTFFLNSITRREVTPPTSLEYLLDIYNRRGKKPPNLLPLTSEDAVIFLAGIKSLPIKPVISARWADRPANIQLHNYFPLGVVGKALFSKYEYLDNDDFISKSGMSYEEFWKSWMTLNKLLISNLPMSWTPGDVYQIQSEEEQGKLERFYDACETGLSGGSLSSIRNSGYELALRYYPRILPLKENYENFIDLITYKTIQDKLDFVEQPFIFYRVSDDAVLWDLARHAGLFKSYARFIVRLSGKTGRIKGANFEKLGSNKLRASIPQIDDIKTNIIIKSPTSAESELEIDIAVVYKKILVLMDFKSRFKPPRYYWADPAAVSYRVQEMEGYLLDADRTLKDKLDLIKVKWAGYNIEGAIYSICSEETEYISSLDKIYWFKVGECPRICLLDELIDYLSSDDFKDVSSHPAFIKF